MLYILKIQLENIVDKKDINNIIKYYLSKHIYEKIKIVFLKMN